MYRTTADQEIALRPMPLGVRVFFRLLLFSFLVSCLGSHLLAAEITSYVDKNGQSVYVNGEDRELRTAVRQGGVAAGLRIIEERKLALPGIDQFIEQESLEQRLDPQLVRAIIQVESAWNVKARSEKGALGLMQLMPETARRFGVSDPFNAKENISGGTRYLRFLLDLFHENLNYSLAAYNSGEKAVSAWKDVPPYAETRTYLRRIEMIYRAKQQEAGLSASGISRTVEGKRIIYTNLD